MKQPLELRMPASQSVSASTIRHIGHMLVTMKAERTIAAGEFKAKCLEILDRVARNGDAIVVTKRGRPVARVVPVEPTARRSLRGSVRYRADIVEPFGDEWTVDG